jgi:hypothetical protein
VKRTIGRIARDVLLASAFVALSLLFRGYQLTTFAYLNPDEAELMVDARAALLSPVPFSTWMTTTIGPVWVLVLAGLGALGLPLTIASAHFLAAVAYGLLGFGVYVLLRRSFGFLPGFTLALVWWLPLALGVPLGSQSDFGAMTTELLPGGLLLGAALIPRGALERRPWLFVFVGALSSLAVFAKYQAAPLAVGLIAFQLIAMGLPWRSWLRPTLWWILGAIAPVFVVGLVMITSPTFSFELVVQNYQFIAAYGHADPRVRLIYVAMILGGANTVA